MHCYIPGWEIPKFRPNSFTDDYGFITDFLAEFMREMRKEHYGDALDKYFLLGKALNQRDTIAVRKMTSGFVKLLYPDGVFEKDDIVEILILSLEMRRRVKEQLKKIGGAEFHDTDLSFIDIDKREEIFVSTAEECGDMRIPDGIWGDGQIRSVKISEEEMNRMYRPKVVTIPVLEANTDSGADFTKSAVSAKEMLGKKKQSSGKYRVDGRKRVAVSPEEEKKKFLLSEGVHTLDGVMGLLLHHYKYKPTFKGDLDEFIGCVETYKRNDEVAVEYVEKRFPPPQMAYDRFMDNLNTWRETFIRLVCKGADIIATSERHSSKRDEILTRIRADAESLTEKIDELSLALVDTYDGPDADTSAATEVETLVTDMQILIEAVKEYE
jgi:hypothetical protein